MFRHLSFGNSCEVFKLSSVEKHAPQLRASPARADAPLHPRLRWSGLAVILILEETLMKYMITLLFALAVLWAVAAQASEPKGVAKTRRPIAIEGGTSPRMTVMFTHKTHTGSGIKCQHCHHESSGTSPYSSCREACHSIPGARERDPMSMFMAFHSGDTDRSCYGCHSSLALKDPQKYPDFYGCRPCHMSPEASEEAAGAAKNP